MFQVGQVVRLVHDIDGDDDCIPIIIKAGSIGNVAEVHNDGIFVDFEESTIEWVSLDNVEPVE